MERAFSPPTGKQVNAPLNLLEYYRKENRCSILTLYARTARENSS
jgi:hypothetical protein